MSVQSRLFLGLALLLIFTVTVIATALSLPATDWHFSNGVESQLLAREGSGSTQTVRHFNADGNIIAGDIVLNLEEPDVVETYDDFNELLSRHETLNNALQDGTLTMVLSDDTEIPLASRQRHFSELPSMFWLQVGCGFFGFLICLLVLAPRPNDSAVRAFALSGLGYLISVSAAALYSTRDFFFDGQLFHALSILNHFGAVLFAAALASLLWRYPNRVAGKWIDVLAYGALITSVIIDAFQLVDGPAMGHYIWTFSLFLLELLGAGVQWWKARHNALERGAVRWMLLSFSAGTFFFTGGILIPAILHIQPPASQGLLFTTFLLLYAGMALGVVRYKLFQLERWWFSIWAWFLGGFAVVVVDILLASLLTLSNTSILAFATAIVGWLYFPVRQWCWRQYLNRRGKKLESWLPSVVPHLLSVTSPLQLEEAWRNALTELLSPLQLDTERYAHTDNIRISNNGSTLEVPSITNDGTLRLQHANHGRRLFVEDDRRDVETLWALFAVVRDGLEAREDGVHSERDRIRRDIHDDLGAKLLTMLHRSSDDEQRGLVRDALSDLRDLLRSMESGPVSLLAACDIWKQEAQKRCTASNVQLQWDMLNIEENSELSPEQFSHLTRVLREAISNGLRHAQPSRIAVAIEMKAEELSFSVDNDGYDSTDDSTEKNGNGIDIIRHRTKQLGGTANIAGNNGLWRVMISIPVSSPLLA